jgi:hypothetical protein
MKRIILAGLVSLGAFFAVQASVPEAQAGPKSCAHVRCMACPEGYHLAPLPNDCCRCLPN